MKWNHSTVLLSFVSSKINFNVSTITLNHVTIYTWCDLQTRWLWEPPMRKLKHAKRPHSVWDCCVSCCWSRSQQSVLCVSIHRQKRENKKWATGGWAVWKHVPLFCFLSSDGTKVHQLSRELANHTAEKHQLLLRYQNLSEERDQLQSSVRRALGED